MVATKERELELRLMLLPTFFLAPSKNADGLDLGHISHPLPVDARAGFGRVSSAAARMSVSKKHSSGAAFGSARLCSFPSLFTSHTRATGLGLGRRWIRSIMRSMTGSQRVRNSSLASFWKKR